MADGAAALYEDVSRYPDPFGQNLRWLLRNIETHAFERINAAGGILGRQVELVTPNPRSRAELRLMKTRQMRAFV